MDYFGFMIFDELHKTIVENGSPELLKRKKIKKNPGAAPPDPRRSSFGGAPRHLTCAIRSSAAWTRFARPLLQNVLLQTQVVLQPQPV